MAAQTWGEEREYNVPLRREWLKAPKYKRAKKAVSALRAFIIKHMKADSVHIGPFLNDDIWKHGMRNPPHLVKVKTKKNEEGVAVVELLGKALPDLAKKEEEEKSKIKSVLERIAGEKTKKVFKKEKKVEEKKEETKEKVEEKKEETKEKVEEKKEDIKEKQEEKQVKAQQEVKQLPNEEKTETLQKQQKEQAAPKKTEGSKEKEQAGKKEIL